MIKIEINCDPHELDAHVRALGFIRTPSVTLGELRTEDQIKEAIRQGSAEIATGEMRREAAIHAVREELERRNRSEQPEMTDAQAEAYTKTEEQFRADAPKVAKANPDRPWGQPSPGKKRRSGAEVAEDEAYYTAHAFDPPIVTNTPRAAEAAISTGAERVDPQDAADEAAETAARKSDKLTLEDVRRAVAVWSEKVGPARAIKELRDILGGHSLIELPEADWRKAVDNLEWAAANPDSKAVFVPNGIAKAIAEHHATPSMPELKVDEPKTGTPDTVIEALKGYGKKFDGTDIPGLKGVNMPITSEDMPKLFGEIFGAKVTGLGSMPQTPEAFGQITAAIVAATRENTFKREVRA